MIPEMSDLQISAEMLACALYDEIEYTLQDVFPSASRGIEVETKAVEVEHNEATTWTTEVYLHAPDCSFVLVFPAEEEVEYVLLDTFPAIAGIVTERRETGGKLQRPYWSALCLRDAIDWFLFECPYREITT